ncbi:MAG: hypothetical protein GY821_05230 [Gammaproteobacteria bacterium]|nr:hypothetical protein [Gammaproteobacteria bacterium]
MPAAVDIYDRKGLSCVADRAHYAELGRLVQTLPPLRKDAFSLEYMKLEVLDKRLGTINQKIAMLNQSRSALLNLKSKMVDLQQQFQDVLKTPLN